ncbi:MAG: SUMF1/EgtB/PvdO family nonheme iron enzyme [Kiritimatiellaeota bacterium]|nr:SUMF1/EgtB/PvdO family nonheme iron enzyme [Kiritimatiellota bacterium]
MPEVKTQCPHCGVRYWVDADFVGESVECEDCGKSFVIRVTPNLPPKPAGTADAGGNLIAAARNGETSIPDLGLTFVQIEPGTFRQGREKGYPEEQPVHLVHITRGFWMGKNLISQKAYERIMGRNPSYYPDPVLPVETVSWYEAREFCLRLTEREMIAGRLPPRHRFRLPSEAQWEYACCTTLPIGPKRGRERMVRETTDFCFGNAPGKLDDYAWYVANSGGRPHPVGTLKASPRELYDLHGNVGEWCSDWFAPYGKEELTDPEGPPEGERKVRRGGGWASVAARCRGTGRIGILPGTRCALIGFRVVLSEE